MKSYVKSGPIRPDGKKVYDLNKRKCSAAVNSVNPKIGYKTTASKM